MTVLEMLDALEGGITALQADRAKLATELADSGQKARTGAAPKTHRRRKPAPKARARKESKPPPVKPAAQAGGTEVEEPRLGKRQALGKSLAQLRTRSSAAELHREQPSGEA